ncbi:MAG TPA: methyltransferase domain-containing protein [Pedomonas sp.]|uniref:SAM-dependent methyltransferase n=1 Tax=Pedomonas sp. TaxID=2976421 RepID=UPI002F42B695
MKAIYALAAAMTILTVPVGAASAQQPAPAAGAPASASEQPSRQPDVPYVPTPQEVVDAMLELAAVKKGDVVYDLGSGDGRIPITAAKRYGVTAMGIDINPQRVKEANENAQKEGVTDRVSFRTADLFTTDLSKANVVTLYLLPDVNLKLRPKLLKELKPGSRIVSHAFNMGDWEPEVTKNIDGRTIYLWTVPQRK